MEEIAVKKETYRQWYDNNREIYDQCGERTKQLLSMLMRQNNVAYHTIEYRTKERESYLNKCLSPKYSDPINQITDLCGIRIITYTNHDVNKICKLIEKEFTIDKENSVNKRAKLEADRVGYLSVHYIAKYKRNRSELPEYFRYKNLRFEIQIRTLLQHAWAEIEHDRSYKFSGELPKDIRRRFYLLAGTLELVDNEFEKLSAEIDKYTQQIKRKTSEGKINIPIDSTSLIGYLQVKFPEIKEKSLVGYDKLIIEELHLFGIRTLEDLNAIITDRFMESDLTGNLESNYLGLLRDIMMAHDPHKYFKQVWRDHWCIDPTDEDELNAFYALAKLNPEVKEYQELILY